MSQINIDYQDRLERLRAEVGALGVDVLVVTDLVNLRWLTGFTGSNGLAVVGLDRFVVATDGRYEIQVADQLRHAGLEAEITISRDANKPLVDAASWRSRTRLGLDANDVSLARYRALAELLPDAELVPTENVVEALRMIKDAAELAFLQQAADIADAALAEVSPTLGTGITERNVADALEAAMSRLGADEPSFDTIVASGPNAARPHARPSDRTIVEGDLVVIDMGARVSGYGSDMTRTFAIGTVDEQKQSLLDAVSASQAAGLAAAKSGVAEQDVDRACRSVLEARGLGDAFNHGTGHGIGLRIHENPFLSARSEGILRSGSVVTVEPGAYIEGVGGVRVEDSVLITDNGCVPLTKSPKDPALPVPR